MIFEAKAVIEAKPLLSCSGLCLINTDLPLFASKIKLTDCLLLLSANQSHIQHGRITDTPAWSRTPNRIFTRAIELDYDAA